MAFYDVMGTGDLRELWESYLSEPVSASYILICESISITKEKIRRAVNWNILLKSSMNLYCKQEIRGRSFTLRASPDISIHASAISLWQSRTSCSCGTYRKYLSMIANERKLVLRRRDAYVLPRTVYTSAILRTILAFKYMRVRS